jgi:hypothetical protein
VAGSGVRICRCYDPRRMSSASARYLPLVGRALRGLFWTALFAVLAAGGAGLVGQAWHPPGSAVRAELTYPGDAALDARLDVATASLAEIADEVEVLADAAKTALAEVTSSESERLRAAVERGDQAATTIEARAAELRLALADLPGAGPAATIEYSNATLVRRSTVLAAIEAASGLAVHWRQVAARATETANLTTQIARHDQTVIAAAADGKERRYQRAIRILDEALLLVVDIQSRRARLIAGSEGTVLDEWIIRTRNFDTALRDLYAALRDCACPGGPYTVEVQFANRDMELARDQLPPDRRTIIVIVSEVTAGGLTDAVIAIDDARGLIESALAEAEPAEPGDSPLP